MKTLPVIIALLLPSVVLANGTFRIVNSSSSTITITQFYKDTYQNGVLYAKTAKSDTTISPYSSLTWNDTAVSGAYANGFEFHYQCSLTAQGDTIVTPYCTADGQTISETLDCTLVECTTNLVFSVKNQDQYSHTYAIGQISTIGADPNCMYPMGYGPSGTESGRAKTVKPGETGTFTVNVPCDQVNDYAIFMNTGDNTSLQTVNVGGQNYSYQCWNNAALITTNSVPWTGTTNNPVASSTNTFTADQNPPGTVWNGANPSGGSILWGSDTNANSVMKQGADALYDATVKGFQQNHSDLSALANALTNLSGIGSGSNYVNLSLTNYALESTSVGISNLLATAITNMPATNPASYYNGQSASSASAGSNSLAGVVGGGVSPDTAMSQNMGDSSSVTWTVAVPYLGIGQIDLNPMHADYIPTIAAFCRAALKWVCLVGMLFVNAQSLLEVVGALGSTRQASASGQSVLGNNLNLVTAIAMAVAITAAMLAIPYFAASSFTTYVGQLAVNPFAGATGFLTASVWLADQFIPLALVVSVPVAIYGFRITLSAQKWAVDTIVRFLVG